MSPPTTGPNVDEVEAALKSVRADARGLQLSWKVVAAVVVFFIGSGAVWTTLGLAKLDDLNDHNKRPTAHTVLHESLSGQMTRRFDDIEKVQQAQGATIATIQDSIFNDRADRLADKAADNVRGNRQKAKDIRISVRAQALYNLRNGKPIDDGIDRKLLY